jgi:hypothetical protein
VLLAGPVTDPAPETTTPEPPASTVVDNEFIPENANLGDCISALPRPDCGSEARGGWRQALVLTVVVGGLAVIGWRLVVGVRRHRPERTP